MKKQFVYIVLLFVPLSIFSQTDDLFMTVFLSKSYEGKENWSYSTSLWYKHIYDHPGWRRMSGFGIANYTYKTWIFQGGFSTQYTFDDEIVNSLELRPWLAVGLKTPITDDLYLKQQVYFEWKNFFYKNDSHENYLQQTVDVGLYYDLKQLKLTNWSLETGYMWYFLKDPALGERFANSREYRIVFYKKMKKATLAFGYFFEKYKDFESLPQSNAHTMMFGVSL